MVQDYIYIYIYMYLHMCHIYVFGSFHRQEGLNIDPAVTQCLILMVGTPGKGDPNFGRGSYRNLSLNPEPQAWNLRILHNEGQSQAPHSPPLCAVESA